MKNLLIIGARGFGREVFVLATECVGYGKDFKVKGFLDDKKNALDSYKDYPPILSPVETYEIQPDDVFICALGDVKWKKHYSEIILSKGGEFISLVHPLAHISRNVVIGKGCIMCRETSVSCDSRIGDFVTILPFSGLGHDGVIKNWTHIDSSVSCAGFVHIEEMVAIHTNATIIPKRVIGRGAIVGAGSVVIRNVSEETTVFGVPAIKL